MQKLTTLNKQLEEHAKQYATRHMRELFEHDPARFQRYSILFNDILFDFSKNLITDETLSLLFELADQSNLSEAIEQLFSGGEINSTEHRPALHTALRDLSNQSVVVNGINITEEINSALSAMTEIVEKLQTKKWLGFSGKAITDVINIGIGGSDLGPAMATYALTPYHQNKIKCHFVSNVDETDIWETIKNLNPETTLFIVASKSFTTQETLCNAISAKNWLLKVATHEQQLENHFIAITAKREKAERFGIKHILPMWSWVGGRFSLWSAIGLPIAISIGMNNFKLFLKGAHEIDQHFRKTEFSKNIPVILALLNIWYVNFFNAGSYAILPYDQYLELLPAYLQQLEMESNGKCVNQQGKKVTYSTSPVIWGRVGCNGQHAFHQLLHQGTQFIPLDFILPLTSHYPLEDHHPWLIANCFSQSKALMLGKNEEEVRAELLAENLSFDQIEELLPHKVMPGNRPSNTILIPKLTPQTLGALIALYEHKVFVQSVIWNINCFDQWGVELGKRFTFEIFNELTGKTTVHEHDSSTSGLINYYKNLASKQ